MSLSVGIIGFPNAGKSTLFKALTKLETRIEARPFTTIEPNIGVVPVPDERLPRISKTVRPEKTTPASIEFVDIAGLVKGAHQGEGLGNQFLGQIRNCRILIEVIRGFPGQSVPHPEGSIDPERDTKLIQTELLMKDLETVEKSLKKKPVLERVLKGLEAGTPVRKMRLDRSEEEAVESIQLLTRKPLIRVVNDGSAERFNLSLDLKIEEELSQMKPKERDEIGLTSKLPHLISLCYQKLDLITFYTIRGGKEARAWSLEKGSTAPEAGGTVHSDFQSGFIRAEVLKWKSLVEAEGWTEARNRGLTRTVGRDYIVQDGDIIEFKI